MKSNQNGKRLLSVITIFTLVILVGCNQEEKQSKMKNVNYTTVKNNVVVDQSPSAKAEDLVKAREETTEVIAVNSKKELILAFNVQTFDRFQLDKSEADVKKELKKEFPNHEVLVSTDKKVFLELEALKGKMNKREVESSKELTKNLKRIKHVKNDE